MRQDRRGRRRFCVRGFVFACVVVVLAAFFLTLSILSYLFIPRGVLNLSYRVHKKRRCVLRHRRPETHTRCRCLLIRRGGAHHALARRRSAGGAICTRGTFEVEAVNDLRHAGEGTTVDGEPGLRTKQDGGRRGNGLSGQGGQGGQGRQMSAPPTAADPPAARKGRGWAASCRSS